MVRPGRFEWFSFALLAPFMALWVNYLLLGRSALSGNSAWLLSYPIVLLHGAATWYLHVWAMQALRKSMPDRQHFARLSVALLLAMVLIPAALLLLFYGYDYSGFPGFTNDDSSARYLVYTGLAVALVTTTMWEAEYTFRRWKEGLAEKEILEQMAIEQEFETLKGQVNPHFLFNCFNTLSSLITEDKKQAEVFLDELSKVYRYLLKNNEDGLSSLDTEIRFIESYYRLLQTRHGEAIRLHMQVDECDHRHLLPSLSLQLLVENAVKHNVLSKNYPLTIDIFTAGDQLVVSNNLQLRAVKAPSNRIGLENIRHKYALLQVQGFQVLKDSRSFSVVLPLLKQKPAEKRLYRIINPEYENTHR